MKKIKKSKILLFKPYTIFLLALILIGLVGPLIPSVEPYVTNVSRRLESPSFDFFCGTDGLGRCVFSRIIYGIRISLGMGIAILIISLVTGGLMGISAGYFGKIVDEVTMRITDIFMTIPSFVIALVLIRALGSGVGNMILVFSLTMWTRYARMVRSLVMNIRNENYIETARLAGLGSAYILRKHILPGIIQPVIAMATLGMGMNILMTSSMSFLGLGITEPVPDWGAMLNNGTAYIRTAPHLAIFPGLVISFTILSFNLLGEALRNER